MRHVKSVKSRNKGMSLKNVLKLASKSYKKQRGGSKGEKTKLELTGNLVSTPADAADPAKPAADPAKPAAETVKTGGRRRRRRRRSKRKSNKRGGRRRRRTRRRSRRRSRRRRRR